MACTVNIEKSLLETFSFLQAAKRHGQVMLNSRPSVTFAFLDIANSVFGLLVCN